ncbi:MAG: hypothetical protein LBB38_01315 [Puniceicoccales bacterium]|jgi:hypothetical protein|nr:hypothetical protein [Puniceicoccales bacterium]
MNAIASEPPPTGDPYALRIAGETPPLDAQKRQLCNDATNITHVRNNYTIAIAVLAVLGVAATAALIAMAFLSTAMSATSFFILAAAAAILFGIIILVLAFKRGHVSVETTTPDGKQIRRSYDEIEFSVKAATCVELKFAKDATVGSILGTGVGEFQGKCRQLLEIISGGAANHMYTNEMKHCTAALARLAEQKRAGVNHRNVERQIEGYQEYQELLSQEIESHNQKFSSGAALLNVDGPANARDIAYNLLNLTYAIRDTHERWMNPHPHSGKAVGLCLELLGMLNVDYAAVCAAHADIDAFMHPQSAAQSQIYHGLIQQ